MKPRTRSDRWVEGRFCTTVAGRVLLILLPVLLAGGWCEAGDDAQWGYVGAPAEPGPVATVTTAPDIARLPYSGVFARRQVRPVNYRLNVPEGTYKVRVHFLQAPAGGATKNNGWISVVANGVPIGAEEATWMMDWSAKDKSLPADLVARVKEAEVPSKDGRIQLFFPPDIQRGKDMAICGIEVMGPAKTLRVVCCGTEPYVDADGNTWLPGSKQRLPTPVSMDIALTKAGDDARGHWITTIGEEFREKLAEQFGLAPYGPGYGMFRMAKVICDQAGHTFFAFSGIGVWRYDGATGHVLRIDGGAFDGVPVTLTSSPLGPGLYVMGSNTSPATFAARTVDGSSFESIEGYARNNGIDDASVDWAADPQVLFIKIHHTQGKMALSVDGGKTYKEVCDDKETWAGIGAVGNKVLLRCMKDGSVMRSADLGATWVKTAELKLKSSSVFIDRLGPAVWIYGRGEAYRSTDAGCSWEPVADAPAFSQAIRPGKKDGQLLGFSGKKAFESADGGTTWKEVLTTPFNPGRWSYDPIHDVFWCGNDAGKIGRYAR